MRLTSGLGFWRERLPRVGPAPADPPTGAAVHTALDDELAGCTDMPTIHGEPPRYAISTAALPSVDPREYAACWSRPITCEAVLGESAILQALEDLPDEARRRVLTYAIRRWPLDD